MSRVLSDAELENTVFQDVPAMTRAEKRRSGDPLQAAPVSVGTVGLTERD